MINWIKSAEINNCTVEWLKDWTDKYPNSNKKVWRVCEGEGCNDERELNFCQCHPLCHVCAVSTPEAREATSKAQIKRFANPEAREAARLKTIEQFSTQETRDAMSEIKKQYHIDNPEVGNIIAKRQVQFYIDNPEVRVTIGNKMRGGQDIVGHHYIYDHSDLTKNIMPMTRSMHMRLHRLFQKYGIIIPHINKEV